MPKADFETMRKEVLKDLANIRLKANNMMWSYRVNPGWLTWAAEVLEGHGRYAGDIREYLADEWFDDDYYDDDDEDE